VKILLIEDDDVVTKNVCFWLKVRYPQVVIISVAEGSRGLDLVQTEMPDLVMIAHPLSNMDTLDLISEIRAFSTVPLIILSNAQAESERASVLEAGADAIVIKPFGPLEIAAWVRVVLRNAAKDELSEGDVIAIGGTVSVNFTTHEVFVSGRRVRMTPIEYRLLTYLVRNAGKLVSHRSLLEKVWGFEYVADSKLVKPHLCRLRRKLGDDPANPQLIRNERGRGYRFIPRPSYTAKLLNYTPLFPENGVSHTIASVARPDADWLPSGSE
jgi:two-component system KDP operon response regulator KdpE